MLREACAEGDEGSAPFRDTYGEVGLLETPSARMADDGQLSFTYGGLKNTNRFNLGFQILPWLEGSFRYSSIAHFNGRESDFDRSFGLKTRLFEETEYLPEISLGIRDIIGTGIYGAEYLVATKKFGPLEATAGLGWGRLAGNGTFDNPFGAIFSSFKVRGGLDNNGGQVNFGQLFHGPDMGVFGGVKWNTPIENLSVIAEYSSDSYQRESQDKSFHPRTPVNVGVAYRAWNSVTLTGGWLYGSTWGLIASIAIDPTRPQSSPSLETPLPPLQVRTVLEQQNSIADFVKNITIAREAPPTISPSALSPSTAPSAAKVFSTAGQTELISRIVNSSSSVRNAEMNGNTVVVDVWAGAMLRTRCNEYALWAADVAPSVQSVALMDMTQSASPVLCDVPGNRAAQVAVAAPLDKPLQDVDLNSQPSAQVMPVSMTTDASAESGAPPATDSSSVVAAIEIAAQAQGLQLEGVHLGTSELDVYYSNSTYGFESSALGRMARVLFATAPTSVESIHLVSEIGGVPQQEMDFVRAPFERMIAAGASVVELGNALSFRTPPLDTPDLLTPASADYPRFSWSLSPQLQEGLFDPSEPLQVQIYAALSGTVQVFPGFAVTAQFDANIYNNFNLSRGSNSLLPHVRSDFDLYLKKGENGISNLYASYDNRLAPDVFYEVKAGYLEDMFAGVGAQVLWRPEGERWAIGADLYEVKQRDYDRLFGTRNYSVLTGHASVYYQSPWYGMNFAIHTGCYLARDCGSTIEVTRQFFTDVEIGAFATFTNVPFSKFGEGSFDKGITIHIPLGWALPFESQSSYDLLLRPLTRDGGQRLEGDDSLYDETRRPSYGEIANHIEDVANP